jgi:uncharacterized protein YbaR (Trm112 family)
MMPFLVCPRCRCDLVREGSNLECHKCGQEYPLKDGIPQFDMPELGSEQTNSGGTSERRVYWDRGWEARYSGDDAFFAKLQSRADWESYLKQAGNWHSW